jgi:hypothetical protein
MLDQYFTSNGNNKLNYAYGHVYLFRSKVGNKSPYYKSTTIKILIEMNKIPSNITQYYIIIFDQNITILLHMIINYIILVITMIPN